MSVYAAPLEKSRPWLPYVAPMLAFLGLSGLERLVPAAAYPLAYAAKVLLTAAVAFRFRSAWRDLRPEWKEVPLAAGTGLLALALWVGLDLWPGYPHLGTRAAFNPLEQLSGPAAQGLFLLVRLVGLALLVPLIEELFWRSFLIRYAITPEDFRATPIGKLTPAAALLTGFAFAAAHPEWLAAAVTAALYTWLLGRSRSVFACVVAHAVTNLGLGWFVLATGSWRYW
ncbi:MAG TPA: CAAX prenyl protease-related protein [Armatimonadota bacterium]|nr:CAAX prenyl protease-related protein [Armatimonadota bacterium]